jgi:hypothetical protein
MMLQEKKIMDQGNTLSLRFQNLRYSYKDLNEIILITPEITSNKVIINLKLTFN